MRLDGDIITANGSILSGQYGNNGNGTISLDDISFLNSGYEKMFNSQSKKNCTIHNSSEKILHILPMHQLLQISKNDNTFGQQSPFENNTNFGFSLTPLIPETHVVYHRASI